MPSSPAERFLAQKMASRGNCYVYILELQDDKFAVGHTESLSKRLHDHWRGFGSAWTRKHRPLRVLDVFKTRPEDALGLEEAKTMELKLTHGFNAARGGIDNNPNEHTPPAWWQEEDSSDQKQNLGLSKYGRYV